MYKSVTCKILVQNIFKRQFLPLITAVLLNLSLQSFAFCCLTKKRFRFLIILENADAISEKLMDSKLHIHYTLFPRRLLKYDSRYNTSALVTCLYFFKEPA